MKTKNIMILFVLLSGITASAQINNTGTITINPKTVMGVVSGFENQESGMVLNDGEMNLYSDFKNEGLVTFSAEEKGKVSFRGNSDQKIEGDGKTEFQTLLIENAPEAVIELYKEISVFQKADFRQGIVKNKDFGGLVVFERGATHVNTSHDSFIDGEIKKIGDEAFVFPVGHNGNFRKAGIAATTDALAGFTANYYYENSDPIFPHSSKVGAIDFINDQEYWILDKRQGTANAILTLSWDEDTTTPSKIVDEAEDLHIVRWDVSKMAWVDEGGIVDLNNKTVTTPISVTGYGVFTLAKGTRSGFGPCKKLVVYNAVSANGDGLNDYFRIEGLKDCTDAGNKVEIFNRWGVKVYETRNYGEDGNVFNGFSNEKMLISGNKQLPVGTYFYVITMFADNGGKTMNKTGYLYLN